jgi:Fungal specific transcription factor domain
VPVIEVGLALSFPDLCVSHLYSSFLHKHSFTGRYADEFTDLKSSLLCYPALYHSALAVSALSIQRQSGPEGRRLTSKNALDYYRSAVSALRTQLNESNVLDSPSLLWSTFFLALFELHYDSSGAGFITHFFHGTSQLLQRRGPSRHQSGAGRRFFIIVRVFEICRALIYTSETFLAQPEWQHVVAGLWDGKKEASEWHPKEAFFDLMVRCSTLAVR